MATWSGINPKPQRNKIQSRIRDKIKQTQLYWKENLYIDEKVMHDTYNTGVYDLLIHHNPKLKRNKINKTLN